MLKTVDSQWRTYRAHGATIRIPRDPAQACRGFVRPAWGNVFFPTPRADLARVIRAARKLERENRGGTHD